jgi:gluconokinase
MTILVVMGVAGSGKSTVAAALAEAQGWVLLEGDAFHPAANVAKMRAGVPLTDEDRWPWLRAIAERADELAGEGRSAVVACSALKRSYRDILIGERQATLLMYLRGAQNVIARRMQARKGHFMPPALLDSQFASLEEPGADERPIVVDIDGPPERVIREADRKLRERLA